MQDEPERVKVEEIRRRLRDEPSNFTTVEGWFDYCQTLSKVLSVSEKRAEEAERFNRCRACNGTGEGDAGECPCAECDGTGSYLIAAERERDSSQASFLRVVEIEREECAKVAEWARVTVPMTEGRSGTVIATRQAIAEAIRARTALSPHTEEGNKQ